MQPLITRAGRRLTVAAALAAVLAGAWSAHSFTGGSPPTAAATSPPSTTKLAAHAAGLAQVSHDSFETHAEPAVAVNPTDPQNLLAAAMVFQGTSRGLATYASFDGGRTWASNGLLPGAGMRYDADVNVTFDAGGHGFVSGVVGDKMAEDNGAAWVWRTDDGGRSLGAPVLAVPGWFDHPGLAADPTPGSQVLYLTGTFTTGDGLRFTRSTDGGKTFEPTRAIDPGNGAQGRLPVVAAGPGGQVAVMYYVYQPDDTAVATVVASTDHGETFGRPTPLAPVHPPADTEGVQARSGPALTADPRTGDLYAAVTTTNGGASEIDLYTSHDAGRSWAAPVTVSRSSTVTYAQSQPAVDNTGRVGLLTLAISAAGVQPLMFVSSPGAVAFVPAPSLTAKPFVPPAEATDSDSTSRLQPPAAAWIGDYQAIASTPGVFHALWNDATTGSLQLMTAAVS